MIIPDVNYEIYSCFSSRPTPRVSLYRSLTLEEKILAVITQDRVIDDNLKRQIKYRTLYTCRLFLLIFIILVIVQKYLTIYPPSFYNINKAINFQIFQSEQFFSGLCRFIHKSNQQFLIYRFWYTSKVFFSDADLVSNNHGCKGEATKLTPYYMIDIIYKTVKASHLKNTKYK